MDSMFDTLLQLPLFQGLCEEDFTRILDKVKLNFSKYKEGEVFIKSGTPCDQLLFLLKGEIACETTSRDETYAFVESFTGPHLIEPYALVGIAPYYVSTYTASTEINTISIEKKVTLGRLFGMYDIFRLNFLNIVSRRAQNLQARIWEEAPHDLEERFVQFVLMHVERHQGEKMLKTKMEDLARYMDNTRLNVSRMLNNLQELELVDLRRKEIIIPDAAKLAEWNELRIKE